ncbi:MAG: DEAD/DEAH box helicase family protein [Chitinophagales bacterium]|nr:DEAD/DEAH box helicase family protein [Chitinophagales bacterium]
MMRVDYTCKVHVVDMIMGSGKSSAAINYMNKMYRKNKFLYVTPFLTEVNRVREQCPDLKFVEPEMRNGHGKLADIRFLLSKGRNIATTHVLFSMFTAEIIDICKSQGYTLIMDEVANVITEYKIGSEDRATLLEKYAYIEKGTGIIRWREDMAGYVDEKYLAEKRLCDLQALACYGDSEITMWLLPIECFNAFEEVYILTYLFEGQIQRYYYDFFKLPYDYLYVKGDTLTEYEFTTEPQMQKIKYDYSKLIHICDNEKLNKIGQAEYDLSKTWFERNAKNNVVLPQLKKNIFNFFHNIQKSPTDNNIWTTFKDYQKTLSGKGYSKGFLPSNSRATNAYKDRTCVAYCLNKYINSVVKIFFNGKGVKTDENIYAVSEMLQFIWRSAVREGNEIWVYIPSSRMRNLLIQWIADNPMSKGE